LPSSTANAVAGPNGGFAIVVGSASASVAPPVMPSPQQHARQPTSSFAFAGKLQSPSAAATAQSSLSPLPPHQQAAQNVLLPRTAAETLQTSQAFILLPPAKTTAEAVALPTSATEGGSSTSGTASGGGGGSGGRQLHATVSVSLFTLPAIATATATDSAHSVVAPPTALTAWRGSESGGGIASGSGSGSGSGSSGNGIRCAGASGGGGGGGGVGSASDIASIIGSSAPAIESRQRQAGGGGGGPQRVAAAASLLFDQSKAQQQAAATRRDEAARDQQHRGMQMQLVQQSDLHMQQLMLLQQQQQAQAQQQAQSSEQHSVPVLAKQELTLDASVRHSPPTKHSRGFALSSANGSMFAHGADARGGSEAPDGSFGSMLIGSKFTTRFPHTAQSELSSGSPIATAPHSAIPSATATAAVSTPLATVPA
jgi:hypothetical protein